MNVREIRAAIDALQATPELAVSLSVNRPAPELALRAKSFQPKRTPPAKQPQSKSKSKSKAKSKSKRRDDSTDTDTSESDEEWDEPQHQFSRGGNVLSLPSAADNTTPAGRKEAGGARARAAAGDDFSDDEAPKRAKTHKSKPVASAAAAKTASPKAPKSPKPPRVSPKKVAPTNDPSTDAAAPSTAASDAEVRPFSEQELSEIREIAESYGAQHSDI